MANLSNGRFGRLRQTEFFELKQICIGTICARQFLDADDLINPMVLSLILNGVCRAYFDGFNGQSQFRLGIGLLFHIFIPFLMVGGKNGGGHLSTQGTIDAIGIHVKAATDIFRNFLGHLILSPGFTSSDIHDAGGFIQPVPA
jgi:hypothetical protein